MELGYVRQDARGRLPGVPLPIGVFSSAAEAMLAVELYEAALAGEQVLLGVPVGKGGAARCGRGGRPRRRSDRGGLVPGGTTHWRRAVHGRPLAASGALRGGRLRRVRAPTRRRGSGRDRRGDPRRDRRHPRGAPGARRRGVPARHRGGVPRLARGPRRCGCGGRPPAESLKDCRAPSRRPHGWGRWAVRQSAPIPGDQDTQAPRRGHHRQATVLRLSELGLAARHEQGLRKNSRAEVSHQPARRWERGCCGSSRAAQQFASVHSAMCGTFNMQRHLISAARFGSSARMPWCTRPSAASAGGIWTAFAVRPGSRDKTRTIYPPLREAIAPEDTPAPAAARGGQGNPRPAPSPGAAGARRRTAAAAAPGERRCRRP